MDISNYRSASLIKKTLLGNWNFLLMNIWLGLVAQLTAKNAASKAERLVYNRHMYYLGLQFLLYNILLLVPMRHYPYGKLSLQGSFNLYLTKNEHIKNIFIWSTSNITGNTLNLFTDGNTKWYIEYII